MVYEHLSPSRPPPRAQRMSEGADAIDSVIANSVPEPLRARFKTHVEEDFTPFDPVLKRTEARDDRWILPRRGGDRSSDDWRDVASKDPSSPSR